MTTDWSPEEVEATVADYLDMLDQELRGRAYNKSGHRHRLAARLRGRSHAAIERKHQNISAVLIELGFVYIEGYKPLRNYQQLLFRAVVRRLGGSDALADIARAQASELATMPVVEDILAARVEPPRSDPLGGRYGPPLAREPVPLRRGVDYLAIEARNRSLGSAGEEFVAQFEVTRLRQAGRACTPSADPWTSLSPSHRRSIGRRLDEPPLTPTPVSTVRPASRLSCPGSTTW